jgi:hypothetical protein
LIYFKNGQTTNSIMGLGHLNSGQNSDVFGWNANYQLSDPWSTVVEQYMFARVNGVGYDVANGISGNNKGDTLYVPGLRASTNPIKGLNVQGEVAWQTGNVSVTNGGSQEAEHRDAFAAQFLTTYALPILDKYKPSVNASYTYVSGDKNSAENYDAEHDTTSAKTYSAWDEFNTIQGAGTIYRSIFAMSNEQILAVGASANPLEDVTAAVTWSDLWAVDSYGAQNPLELIQPNGDTVSPVTKHDATGLGNETDVNLTYNYTEDVTFGLNLGWFVSGSVLSTSNRETASQAIASLGVKF